VGRVATIGVYCWSAESFTRALHDAGVTLLVDVRQRRGVRGPKFTWANAKRLEALLDAETIGYSHHPELAPTTELRHALYREDAQSGVGIRSRQVLPAMYVRRYTTEILDRAPLGALLEELEQTRLAALFCVECAAAACHRSLIAERLRAEHGYRVRHLTPPETES
jgi:uncharacterized protein (DUF488 family)